MKSRVFAFLMILSHEMNAQKWAKVYSDTNAYSINTAAIAGKKYIGYLSNEICFVLNAKGDTLIKKRGSYNYESANFEDITKDGYQDLVLVYTGNTPMVLDLFTYVPAKGKFKEINDFKEFPAPKKIPGSKYYYSYHRSGCADLYWDSDLFYIENYKVVRLGNISGNGCEDENSKKAIYIYNIQKGKKKLVKTFPYNILSKYKDFKWGFIKEYWTKNYHLFSK